MGLPTVTITGTLIGPGGQQITVNALQTEGPWQIPYLETLDYKESFNHETGGSATRTCYCRWEDRYKWTGDMLGTSYYSQGAVFQPPGGQGAQTGLIRIPPAQHPEVNWLYAASAELIEPMGVPTQTRGNLADALMSGPNYGQLSQRDSGSNMVNFNMAKYSVTYTPRDYVILGNFKEITLPAEPAPDPSLSPMDPPPSANPYPFGPAELQRYISRYWKPSAENLLIPGSAFKFISDGLLIPEPPAKTFPLLELRYVWREVPFPPYNAIEATIGKCNQAMFDGVYPAQTVLMAPPEWELKRSAAGDWVYDITYIFLFKAKTWNALFRRSVGANSAGPDQVGQPGFDFIGGTDASGNLLPTIQNGLPTGNGLATPTADFTQLFILQ